ncbi:aldo/keto reductase [Streptomyces sp. NPDC059142]|uniref:aldo/keto reductase n=1 Tax=Streptomyces sp. NPDC059142 TaxID=3346739 RepID=UPI0036B9D06D
MRTRKPGGTGIEVSARTLDTTVFGRTGHPDHGDSARMIHRALDAGGDAVDTAVAYGYGETGKIVGKALAGRRAATTSYPSAPPALTDPDPRRRPLPGRAAA